jgi:tRNA modification GTPase
MAPRELLAVGRLAYGHVLDAEGRVLDEIILHRAGPQTWELSCHGGPAAVEAVCDRLASLGLAPVDADALLASEGLGPIERAVRRLLQTVATPLAARILLDQFVPAVRGRPEEGKRGGSPYPPRDKAIDSQRAVGMEIHRAARSRGVLEQALADVAHALAADRTDEAAAAIDALLGRWETCGRYLAKPPRVVIAGRPNVGKSTLLNRLAGRERAITHPEPGTTRDYVETVAAFDGLPVVLVDTAGLRETLERIEREGVARARRQAAGADLVVYLLDAESGATEEDEKGLAALGDRALAVWNKADLAARSPGTPAALAISAQTGEGLDALRQEVLARLDYGAPPPGAAVPFSREQADALRRAAAYLAEGRFETAAEAISGLMPRG